jgi:ribosomal-protein-alanine N-acetyltransferase
MQISAKVIVRCATVADLDGVMEIDRATPHVSHWSRDAYEKYQGELRESFFHRCLLIGVGAERVIGFVAGSFLEGDDAAVLENLAVDAAWRRRGVAKMLCAAMVDWAKAEGAWGVDLEVRASNDAAMALYRELRFVQNGRRRNYYSDPEEDAVLMALKLRP